MSNSQRVELDKIGSELNALILKCSTQSRERISKQARNYTLKMVADAKKIWYGASGLNVISGLLIGGYDTLYEDRVEGDTNYLRIGVKNADAMSGGVNYAVVQEYGGDVNVAVSYHRTSDSANPKYDDWGDVITGHFVKGHTRKRKARLVATNAVRTQGQIFVNRILREVKF